MKLLASILLCLALAGCAESKQVTTNAVDNAVDVAVEATTAISDKTDEAQVKVGEAATPVAIGIREAIEAITPEPLPVATPVLSRADHEAVALIVRWEVGSAKQYIRQYQGVICPGGASGPTIGIGYDLGTQTANEIRSAWSWHPNVDALATASGQVGPGRCAAWKADHLGIRVTYAEAIRVFTERDWPAYLGMGSRAYRNGWTGLTDWHRYGLGSNGYNRGYSFAGSRNAEKRHTRDVCVPANDAKCTANDFIASCRIWLGQNIYTGLCNRRKDEARFVQREG